MKKALSMLLVLVMLLGMMPMQVFATEVTQETEAVEVVTEPSEAPEEETTAPTEETKHSEEEEKTEPSGEEEGTESPDEEEETEPPEPSESEEEAEVIHEHDYEAVVTDPTCTEQGYTTYTCECGDSYVDDYVEAEHNYSYRICAVCGNLAEDAVAPDSLDDIAWEDLTFYDIFIENNLAYVDGFDRNDWGSYSQYAGTNTITDDVCVTKPYSLKAFGTPSHQIVSSVASKAGEYFVASKVFCTRYVKGELGVCPQDSSVGITSVTDGFVTVAGIVALTSSHKIYIGSIHSADLDGYVDDPVVVNMGLFATKPTTAQLTRLYEQYVQIEMTRDRTETIHTDGQKYDAFMDYLQDKAKVIGMTSSVFGDPVGNSCNKVTARDVAKLLAYTDTYEQLDGIWSLASKDVMVTGDNARTQTVVSTVHTQELEQYYHILGGKTGTLGTTRNLAVILEIPNSNDRLIVVALCANGLNGEEGNRYQAVKEIADAAMNKYKNPEVDNSTLDVCCASAIACVLAPDGSMEVLYEKDADTLRNPASISKVLTAICALDIFDDLEAEITYKQFDINTSPWYAKDFYIGDTMSLEDTLCALLLPSSDVTAFTVARSAGEILLKHGAPHVHFYSLTVTAPTCTEQGYTTYTCECGDSYVDDYVDASGEHTYENGVCTGCGNKLSFESMSLRYDDHLDMSGKTVEIIDAGTPTSYQVGYGVEENAVLDTAVVTLESNTLVATGIGTAVISIDGVRYEIEVTAAPISLLLLIGQSNMRGSEGNADQSIVCPDGMIYATFGDDRGDAEGIMNVNNATNFAASALTGEYSTINVNGTTDNLSYYPINSLTEAGKGTFGPDSGFAYEWVKQTGEKVWVVNAAHGGSSITSWQPNATNFKEAVLLFSACQETLRKEIAAGHFTLSHMGYFWCQGCSDYNWTAEKYVTNYLAMHDGLKSTLAFDHDGSSTTDSVIFEFAGIIPVRAGHDYNDGYREDKYTDTTSYKFYESYLDLQMTGPRVAQYWMCNNPEQEDIWMVCNVGEDWVWMPDGTNGVSDYFQAHYENGTVDYSTQVQQKASWYTPTTPKEVHDSIHYNQIGYNEIGRESARNALIMLGEIAAPEVETTVELVGWDGYTPVNKISASLAGNSSTLVVPKVYPVWKTKEVSCNLTEGFNWSYYDILANNEGLTGALTMGGQTVTIEGHNWSEWETLYEASADGPGKQERTCSHCDKVETREIDGVWQIYKLADHLLELPEDVCCDTNLWAILPHEDVHFTSGKKWGTTSTHTTSVTIPVNPGDRIYATSWQKAGENGHATSNGIRVTFFSAEGIAKTMGPGQSDREFYANGGYLIAPEGTIAINIVMWYDSEDYEVYILNRDHIYENGTCAGCGDHIGPVITRQPESVEQEIGKKFAITVKAEGEGLTYQWYVKESGAKAFKVSSNKTASYAYTMQTYMHNRQVYCVITDANGNSVQTETATITRPPQALKILEQPKDAQQEIGQKFSISPKVEGEGLTYQWYVKESGAKAFKVSSIKGSAYALTMQKYMIGRQVYCVITDKHGNTVTTDVATISLPPVELKILEQPTDVYAAKGEKFSIKPAVQGDGLTYQWYYKEGYKKDFKPSSNKTSAYAYSMQTYMNERSVYCVITDKYGNQVQTEVVTIHLEK